MPWWTRFTHDDKTREWRHSGLRYKSFLWSKMKVKRNVILGYMKDRGYTKKEFQNVLGLDDKSFETVISGKRLAYDTEVALIKYFTPTIAEFLVDFDEKDFSILKRFVRS